MYFGAESASETVLEYYNKKIKPAQIVSAVANAKEAGHDRRHIVHSRCASGVGRRDQEDHGMISGLRPHAVEINILDYLVGTPLWQQMEVDGIIGPDDWKRNHRVYEYVKEKDRNKLESVGPTRIRCLPERVEEQVRGSGTDVAAGAQQDRQARGVQQHVQSPGPGGRGQWP